ncbi:hypothetical protein HPB49_007297 [Dermacentor silvarum]|uniref:Uncharacterized protein n=1 Tax=Dermacentor silvarum TaxID=543639 RepID=A0ACB8D3S1_DERSI|nr:hypothetical protein HPB49_007297 [Dermacentor silvarum]
MASSVRTAQATPGDTPRPEASLLTGFSNADTHKAIQDNVYVILGHGAFQRRVLHTGILSVVVLLMHALGSRLFTHDVRHWCAPPYKLRDVPVDVWRNAAIPLGPDGEPSQCDFYDPPIPVSSALMASRWSMGMPSGWKCGIVIVNIGRMNTGLTGGTIFSICTLCSQGISPDL